MKINNGSNAKDSSTIKIKVRKITAVKKIDNKNDIQTTTYSKEDKYWLCEDSGVVYDYELNYPVGKIEKDANNNFITLDANVYVITDLIDIPKIILRD